MPSQRRHVYPLAAIRKPVFRRSIGHFRLTFVRGIRFFDPPVAEKSASTDLDAPQPCNAHRRQCLAPDATPSPVAPAATTVPASCPDLEDPGATQFPPTYARTERRRLLADLYAREGRPTRREKRALRRRRLPGPTMFIGCRNQLERKRIRELRLGFDFFDRDRTSTVASQTARVRMHWLADRSVWGS